MKVIVVLHNIRSIYNVGAILRTCEGLGVEKVVYSGYTPRYDDPCLLPHLREKLNRQIEKAALGAEKLVEQVRLGGSAKNDGDECNSSDGGAADRGTDNRSDAGGGDVSTAKLLTFLQKCATMEYRIVGLENNLTGCEVSRKLILGEKSKAEGDLKPSTDSELSARSGRADVFDTGKIVLILGEEVHGIPAEIREKCEYFLEIPMQGQKESFNVSVAAGIALWGLKNLY